MWREYADAGLVSAGDAKYRETVACLRDLLKWRGTIVLCGARTYRNGKSYLLSAAVNLFCEEQRSARYLRSIDFFRALKSTFSSATKQTAEDYIRSLYEPELLAIDEFHVRGDTDFENNEFRSLIDARHGMHKRTVLAGNMAQSSLKEYLEPAMVLRINEGGGSGAQECNWAPWWRNQSGLN